MAQTMLAFQRQCDWDFMKVNPRADYHVEDWGVRLRYSDSPYQGPTVLEHPVKRPEDWLKLKPLDIRRGVLGQHLEALGLIARELKGEVPFLMTVFTPLSIASRLATSEEVFLAHLREHTEKVQAALEVVTETFTRFARACLERGASGLFFATTSWGTYDRLNDQEYNRFGRTYDLKLLRALPPADFHVLHVCRDRNMLKSLADYPVAAFNWDARGQGNLSLTEGRELMLRLAKEEGATPKAVIGGVSHRTLLLEGTPLQVAAEVQVLKRAMGSTGWMLGPGCTYSPKAPESNVLAIKAAAA
jgi:uroporphyrinogen decarboxylase